VVDVVVVEKELDSKGDDVTDSVWVSVGVERADGIPGADDWFGLGQVEVKISVIVKVTTSELNGLEMAMVVGPRVSVIVVVATIKKSLLRSRFCTNSQCTRDPESRIPSVNGAKPE